MQNLTTKMSNQKCTKEKLKDLTPSPLQPFPILECYIPLTQCSQYVDLLLMLTIHSPVDVSQFRYFTCITMNLESIAEMSKKIF